jgi:hypothetical protein
MNLIRCPKCGHAPLPSTIDAATACPGCGVIFAKLAVAAAKPAASAPVAPGADGRAVAKAQGAIVPEILLFVPPAVDRAAWLGRLVTLLAFCVWTVAILAAADVPAGQAGSHFLWAVLTPFHEAGHYLIFRWFGEFIMILGGTLGQHLMPLLLAGALLLKRHDPFGAALFTWLFGFSLLMMAVYMYDAHDPVLVLLDGRTGADSDGHDWQNLFGDLGLLRHARGIGVLFGWAARLAMLASLLWAAWVLRLQHAALVDDSAAA